MTATLLLGDALAQLATLPDASVQCCVSSPPYWGLRAYLPDDHDDKAQELGTEKTPEAYVAAMVAVFREVRRVLRSDGTLFLNLGDSYAANGISGLSNKGDTSTLVGSANAAHTTQRKSVPTGLKPKDLVGIPWRTAFALQADGWYLRSDIIWSKPNPMPESVTDRPTKSHEYLFLLTKNARYHYDAAAIAERSETIWEIGADKRLERVAATGGAITGGVGNGTGQHATRNKRTVWTIATQPYAGAHFATMPEALVEPCIGAGTSQAGCCPTCAAPWERVVERTPAAVGAPHSEYGHGAGRNDGGRSQLVGASSTTTGWHPTCAHGGEPVPCVVLDPFTGSGTVGAVALRMGRQFVGVELNPAYLELAQERMRPWLAQGRLAL